MSEEQSKNNIPVILPFEIKGDWYTQSKQLQEKFSSLTAGDLRVETGRENEMLKCIESRLHINRDEAISIIEKNYSEQN